MDCLFCKIVNGEIPANVVYEEKDIMAFQDIKPQAPEHILIIPKRHIETIDDIGLADIHVVGKMVFTAKQIAESKGLNQAGYRLVFNVRSNGGQEVYHIHLHMLGGRQMKWPPG